MDMKEKLEEILRQTRYEYRRYIAMKDYEKRMAKTEEEFCAVDDSIVGEIPFCADFLIANGVTVQEGKPLEAFLHPIDAYKGLKAKYLVFKADTGEKVDNCFILRPDKDPVAVEAIRAYASATDNETLAEDIYNWVGKGGPVQDATDNNVGRKWISVKDRLPQEDEPEATTCEQVQVLLDNGVVSTGWCNRYFKLWWHLNYGETHFVFYDYEHTPVIAWQPLAQPPKGE